MRESSSCSRDSRCGFEYNGVEICSESEDLREGLARDRRRAGDDGWKSPGVENIAYPPYKGRLSRPEIKRIPAFHPSPSVR